MGAGTPYEVFEERKWMFFIVGFAPVQNLGYFIYVTVLVALQVFMQTMAAYAAFLLSSRKSLLFDAIHVIVASWFAIWGLLSRFFAKRSLLEIMNRSKIGIYNYSEEELDEEQIEMNKTVAVQIKKKSNIVLYMYTIGFLSNTVFFPLSQMFLIDETKGSHPDFLNPYLPHVFYTPFNTRTVIGYTVVYVIDFVFILFVYVTAVLVNTIFIATTEMMKVQFQVLNHSIKKIQQRAYRLYMKKNNIEPRRISEADLIKSNIFQSYLFQCLKENIKHHQALLRTFEKNRLNRFSKLYRKRIPSSLYLEWLHFLDFFQKHSLLRPTFSQPILLAKEFDHVLRIYLCRFREDCRLFIGSILLDVFLLAAMIYASILYQMYQTHPVNVLVNYTCTSLAEQTYTYFICTFGEDMIEESNKIFLTLYSTNWFHYDDKFKQILSIMMVNSRKPVNFKAIVLDIPASMETYSDSLSCMYKIMSVARQSDVLH